MKGSPVRVRASASKKSPQDEGFGFLLRQRPRFASSVCVKFSSRRSDRRAAFIKADPLPPEGAGAFDSRIVWRVRSSLGTTTPDCSTAPTWKPASAPRRHPSARKNAANFVQKPTQEAGPWRTRLLRLGSYPVTFGDRCDATATCLVTFLRTTLTPLTPLFVVTV